MRVRYPKPKERATCPLFFVLTKILHVMKDSFYAGLTSALFVYLLGVVVFSFHVC